MSRVQIPSVWTWQIPQSNVHVLCCLHFIWTDDVGNQSFSLLLKQFYTNESAGSIFSWGSTPPSWHRSPGRIFLCFCVGGVGTSGARSKKQVEWKSCICSSWNKNFPYFQVIEKLSSNFQPLKTFCWFSVSLHESKIEKSTISLHFRMKKLRIFTNPAFWNGPPCTWNSKHSGHQGDRCCTSRWNSRYLRSTE